MKEKTEAKEKPRLERTAQFRAGMRTKPGDLWRLTKANLIHILSLFVRPYHINCIQATMAKREKNGGSKKLI